MKTLIPFVRHNILLSVLVAILIFLSGTMFVLQQTILQKSKTDDLVLQFPKMTVGIGETVRAELTVTTDQESYVDIGMFDFIYNPDTLTLVKCTPGDNFEAIVAEENPCTIDPNKPGVVQIDVESKDDLEPRGKVVLAYLYFEGHNEGSPAFTFTKHEIITEKMDEPVELSLSAKIKPEIRVVSR